MYLNTKYKIVFCISNTYLKYMYLKYRPSLATNPFNSKEFEGVQYLLYIE